LKSIITKKEINKNGHVVGKKRNNINDWEMKILENDKKNTEIVQIR
jgi:hypothetical protein